MIEIKNINKKIGNVKILDNVSFTVNQGEILGFLGPNGAGKTTTMKIITSFWRPDSGAVTVGGKDTVKNSLATRAKIGYLAETVPLYDDMKVYEYLKFVAEMRDIPKSIIKEKIRGTIDACGLSGVTEKTVDDLSKGYRQRLGLAQAIIHEPEVLILDEPTTGLDPNQIVEIRELIRKIGREKTVIFSTHVLTEASAICSRVVIINNGTIVGQGNPDELAANSRARDFLYVKIKGKRDEILALLEKIENIIQVSEKDKEADDIFGYEIETVSGIDVREDLGRLVAEQGASILELNKTKASLEDIFRELTK